MPSEQGVDEIHPLLRAFLEEKFRELAGDRSPAIVELVVRTHLGREKWDDAFSIVERFFDGELLVEVVETALPRVLLEARLPTLARWVECAVHHEVDAPVFDLAEGELAFRADRTRSEALGLQAGAARRRPCPRLEIIRARRRQRPPIEQGRYRAKLFRSRGRCEWHLVIAARLSRVDSFDGSSRARRRCRPVAHGATGHARHISQWSPACREWPSIASNTRGDIASQWMR